MYSASFAGGSKLKTLEKLPMKNVICQATAYTVIICYLQMMDKVIYLTETYILMGSISEHFKWHSNVCYAPPAFTLWFLGGESIIPQSSYYAW